MTNLEQAINEKLKILQDLSKDMTEDLESTNWDIEDPNKNHQEKMIVKNINDFLKRFQRNKESFEKTNAYLSKYIDLVLDALKYSKEEKELEYLLSINGLSYLSEKI